MKSSPGLSRNGGGWGRKKEQLGVTPCIRRRRDVEGLALEF